MRTPLCFLIAFALLAVPSLAFARVCSDLFKTAGKAAPAAESEAVVAVKNGVSAEFLVDVRGGHAAFQIEVWGRNDQLYTVDRLVDPRGNELVSPASPDASAIRSQAGVATGFVSLIVRDPKRPNVYAGKYRVRIKSQGVSQPDHDVTVRVVRKPKVAAAGRSRLKVKTYVASGVPLEASSPAFKRLMSHVSKTFASLGVDLDVEVLALDSSFASVKGDAHLAELFASGSGDSGALKLFFVSGLSLPDLAHVHGYSFGIPGPSSAEGLKRSGAVLVADWVPGPQDSESALGAFAEQFGNVVSHELMHFLGLSHTYEQRGGQEDVHADTSKDDWTNAMSPLPPRGGVPRLSPQQVRELKGHPLLK